MRAATMAVRCARPAGHRPAPAALPRRSVPEVLRAPGEPLDRATRAFMEPRFGHDFSRVRVHRDPRAQEAARSLGARAFTAGHHIAFAADEHRPDTGHGRRLLAHELAHVLQQTAPGAPAAGTLQRQMAGEEQETAPPATDAPATVETVPQDGPGAGEGGDGGQAVPQSSGPGPSGGKPDPSIPDCTAVMGGRQVDYWAAKAVRAQHTFMNFKLDAANYWLVEGGPLPSDPSKTGAWAKKGDWDTRGERVRKTYDPETCAAVKKCLLDTTDAYHKAGVSYSAVGGPNSNSFMEQLTFKCGDLPRKFGRLDIAWDYWTTRTRPF